MSGDGGKSHTLNDKLPLLSIVSYARSGALNYAWRLLREGGYDKLKDDPAALCVVGRLLKDRALGVSGEARRALYLEAAEAYARAGDINGAAYPIINAATLSFLSGQIDRARELAGRVLETIEDGEETETPYYLMATKAEAYLLLGDVNQARSFLSKAIALAPLAYEDHASTLRQFGLILDILQQDKAWLDDCRPPRCLHFAGHMDLSSSAADIRQMLGAIIEEERVGYGFGALAAGADILIAEALIEHGAELHVLFPSPASHFREVSVEPFGSDWVLRFDRVLEQATTVSVVGDGHAVASPNALQVASEVAMGRVVMQANALMTEPIQLVVLDPASTGKNNPGSSRWASMTWAASGRRQRALFLPRANEVSDSRSGEVSNPQEVLAAVLRITWPSEDNNPHATDIVARVAEALTRLTTGFSAARWTGDAVVVAFDTPNIAAGAALSVVATLKDTTDLSVAGHYGIAERIRDPFGGPSILTGTLAALPREILFSTPPGVVYVTEEFAAALYAGPDLDHAQASYVGDVSVYDEHHAVQLFALRSACQN